MTTSPKHIGTAPPHPRTTVDAHGRAVAAGTVVQVPAIDDSLLAELAPPARGRVQSMRGQRLVVYEVDVHGHAWVERWWRESAGDSTSHSLALRPQQMKTVG